MRTRVVLSLVLVLLYVAAMSVYGMMQGPIEAKAAVGQLSDSTAQYSLARATAMGMIPRVVSGVLGALLLVIWVPILLRSLPSTTPLLLIVSAGLLVGCVGPFQKEVVEEIGPNETAFLVPLEGDTKGGQGKFMSIEYLNGAKVATKRVTIPTRKRDTGRMAGDFEWIPTMRLIKVDRTPVTRVWTQDKDTGTSVSNQAICVESRESVDFCAGSIAISAVAEEDAAKFLYHYAGKSLAVVMDQDVRGYLGAMLSREFGSRTLDKGRTEKNDIFTVAQKATTDFFKERGVTISQIGGTEGLQYRDEKIQQAINATFVAENDKNTAENQRQAQAKRNELNVAKAIAERQAAEEFAKAKEAQIAIRELEIRMVQATATLEAAKKWNGSMPSSIVPQGSNMLFGLDRPVGQK
ncbi:MAG: hypothetical protein Q7K16_03730 [Candidatus Azambacteria bacterium]|nr:hypothetical protein [Candidatus Azambacteria bacterium]